MLSALRIVARRMRSEPGFYVLVIVCLSAGIGATTTVFAVVDASLFRPLAYPDADELVSLAATLGGSSQRYYVSPANFIELRDRSTTFRSLSATNRRDVDLQGEGEPVRLTGVAATPDLFETLGVAPVAGRALRRGDEGAAVAVIVEGAWQRHFGRDPGAVGATVMLSDRAVEIVGVVPDGTAFPSETEVWLPYGPEDATPSEWHGGSLIVVGRLLPGRTRRDAAEDLARVDAHLQQLYPATNGGRATEVTDLREPIVRDVEPLLALILAAVALFLLAACANVAAVMMVRAGRERWRVAVRKALGASSARITCEAVAEGVVVGLMAGILGVAVAVVASPLLSETLAALPPGVAVRIDHRVLAAATVMSLAAALLLSALPAWTARGVAPHAVLSANARGAGPRGQRRIQAIVVGGQAAFSVLLLLVAAGTVDRLVDLLRTEPGFAHLRAVTARVPVSDQRYPDHARRTSFFERIGEALRAMPGVTAVGAADVLPIGDPGAGWSYSVEDRPPDEPTAFEVARGRLVIPGYFEALGIPLVAGRLFTAADRAGAEPVAVVSRHMAELHWPGQDPLGKRIKRRTYDSEFPWMRVIGVVGDVRDASLDADIGATLYLAYAQHDTRLGREMSFVVRTERTVGDVAAELRTAVGAVDAGAPIVRIAEVADLLDDSVAPTRLVGRALAAFAAVGLLLMGLGIYGVVARTVQSRRREVGTRIALGARPAQVVGLMLRHGGAVLVGGAAAGLAAAPLIGRIWSAALGEALTVPGWAYPVAALLTCGIGALACLLPSSRAASVDPMLTLRGG